MKTSINLGWLKAYVHNGMFTTYTINWCRISQPSTVTGTAPLGPALIHGVTEAGTPEEKADGVDAWRVVILYQVF